MWTRRLRQHRRKKENSEPTSSKSRRFGPNKTQNSRVLNAFPANLDSLTPGAFVFCERASGAARFQVEAVAEGRLPVEPAARLLAMHCLVRGLKPSDYTVLVAPREILVDSLGRRAQELLDAGRAIQSEARMSPREREVLECVLRNLSNKEIGARLNVCERTVKYHVSALLTKFNVPDRVSLMREATSCLRNSPGGPSAADTLFGSPMPENAGRGEQGGKGSRLRVDSYKRACAANAGAAL